NDPVVADLLVRQRRVLDPAKRREVVYEIQRYLAKQQYYVQLPSGTAIAVWEGALKNYGPNLGYDYGGRLMGAWLDRQQTGDGPAHTEEGDAPLRRPAPADRDPVAPHRVADRLHPAEAHPGRRRRPHAGGEGLRPGPRGAAHEARPRPAPPCPVPRVAGAG